MTYVFLFIRPIGIRLPKDFRNFVFLRVPTVVPKICLGRNSASCRKCQVVVTSTLNSGIYICLRHILGICATKTGSRG